MTAPLPWQTASWKQITTDIATDRLSAALVVAGPAGIGKRRFAQALCARLLCESPRAEHACGSCRGCQQHAAGVHPNLSWLSPEEDRRDISIERLRTAMERLFLASHYSGRKLLVLDPAEALNLSGSNALLKTLEEPPANTHLILIAERLSLLLPTLRSRCRIVRMAPPSETQARAWLQQERPQYRVEPYSQSLRAPLRVPPDATEEAEDPQKRARALCAVLARGPSMEALKTVERVDKGMAEQLCQSLLIAAHTALKQRLQGSPSAVFPELPLDRLSQWTHALTAAVRKLNGNAHPQMLLESLIIDFWRLSKSGPTNP